MKLNKLGLLVLATSALVLAACGGGEKGNSNKSSKKPTTSVEDSSVEPIEYTVTIKGADGAQISQATVESGSKIEKPADPTAPAGQVFYGWMNTKNGGQIWDFEDDHELNCVMKDVELVPCFVPAGMNAQILEAELCPDITAGSGMDGATYSGGSKGKGLIGRDYDEEIDCTCIEKYSYYALYDSQADIDEGNDPSGCAELTDELPTDKVAVKKDVDVTYGAYVHFNYKEGNTLTWVVNSDKAASDVTLFARYSAEYGKPDPVTFDNVDSFNDEMYKVKVNGEALKYGSIEIHNIEGTSGAKFIHCQDYLVSTKVSLKQGENIIQMVVDNNITLNGTIAASAPVVDSIKLFSDSTITWPNCKVTNLVKD